MSRLPECIEIMARDGIDVLLLGREANARTVSDAARLWLAGTRPFAPGCVVVGRTGAVHLLSNTDVVAPTGFPVENLYGITWNPEKLISELRAIDGVRDAKRVGVDGMSPMAETLLAQIVPDAEIVDAGALFAELWTIPDPEKPLGVAQATAVAERCLAAMVAALRPGVRPRDLRGEAAAASAAAGVTTPAFEAVVAPFEPGSSTWLPPERTLLDTELVVLRAGVLRDGWEGSVARTYTVSSPPVERPAPAEWNALVGACAAGATVGAIRARGAVVHGAGRGVEPWPDDLVLVPGLMVALEVRDDTSLRQDIVRIT
jgi:Xaa-Pro dipeptidase